MGAANEKGTVDVQMTKVSSNEDHTNADLDAGAKYLMEHSEHADYTEQEAQRVLRKIDWILMPVMTLATTIGAADKIVISNAAAYGMKEGLNLVGNQYSWIGSIFYFGYLIMELPANMILLKLPVGKAFFISYLAWNIVLMCMGAANNFAQMGALRFLLGMGEAFLSPTCAVIIAMFYKKSEQPFRTAICFSGFSSLITGILSYAVGHASTKIDNWRLLFIVFGCLTILVTTCIFFVIPDSPMTCSWLNERQRYIAIDRTMENRTGIQNRKLKQYQFMEAIKDWKTWIIGVFALCNNISNGALVTFAAQIVTGLGYSPLNTTLLGMPTGLFMTGSSCIIALPSYFYPKKYRTISAFIICLVPLICCILMMKLNEKTGLLISYYFFYFYWGPYVCMISLSFANTAGQSKKTVVNAVNFTSYCISNIIAPQFFIASQAPSYPTGYNAILGFTSGSLLCIAIYGVGCILENKRRDKEYGSAEANVDPDLDALDLTDKEKERWFRYVW
ncbi:Piso0_001418 [Millerozyma farinosa CBS 7064]|uniref:Piso0_001418 protein n=1 Tax=Pichia sorbitophila (strain ATCC MYA-4447 / BCRC 22081 / CBS 7064 / NBRC 10061 / NRRL Y-12695) TaxID=559304 RepID=G8YN43_PICSO|nr:Piso0_001418 [Millerozyma farinosa CBS 7064]